MFRGCCCDHGLLLEKTKSCFPKLTAVVDQGLAQCICSNVKKAQKFGDMSWRRAGSPRPSSSRHPSSSTPSYPTSHAGGGVPAGFTFASCIQPCFVIWPVCQVKQEKEQKVTGLIYREPSSY